MRQRVLIISHFFPPLNEIASLRMYAFAKYIGEYHDVIVLTSEKHPDEGQNNLHLDESTFSRVDINYLPKFIFKQNFLARIAKLFFVFQHRLGGIWDFKIIWARRVMKWFEQNHDPAIPVTVICSYSPVHTFLAGYWIKRRFANVTLVLDYRDLWYSNPYVKVYKAFSLLQRMYERRLLRVADYVITVSRGLAEDLLKNFNVSAAVIPNGFFSEEVVKPSPKSNSKLSIAYTGHIYKSRRDPEPLFLAVSELLDESFFSVNDISIDFYGAQEGLIKPAVDRLRLNACVKVHPKVSRGEVLKIQREATCLLFLEWDDPRASGVLTGKLFEYLVSGSYILSIGPNEQAESSMVIAQTQSGFVCGKDVVKIKEALRRMYLHPDLSGQQWDVINQYNRKNQSIQLMERVGLGGLC